MVARDQVVAYRSTVHGLTDRGPGAVLDVGVQDHPTGVTARLAVALRGGGDGVLVHSVRAATHLHRAADLGLLAGALRVEDGNELAKASIGPFGEEVGAGFGTAIDEVAAVMTAVMSDGVLRTKGELSGAVSPQVDRLLAPWCGGCGVHHVQDALFRYATLQAGLTIDVESPKAWQFRPPVPFERVAADVARAELVRRLLHVAGPAKPTLLASWLALTPAAARRWWSLVADELERVSVDGHAAYAHAGDVELLAGPPSPPALRLLGPYDPLTEIADRVFTVPDAADRRQVWSPAGNPGVVVVHGEIAGIWRRRTQRGSLTLTVTPFDARLADRAADVAHRASGDADVIARSFGAHEVRIELVE